MTLGDIAIYARNLVDADSVSWTDANLLIGLNVAYQKVVSMILESADESDFDDARKTDYPIKTTPLAANQRDYSIPVSEKVTKIKRVDITYDGTNWYKSEPIDDGAVNYDMGANQTITDQNFIQSAPRHDVKYNSIWIYPAPTSSIGSIRIEWERQVTEFTGAELTAGTVVPGFDDPFHPMICYIAAYDFAMYRQLPQLQQLQTSMVDWEARLRQHYGRKELDRRLSLSPYYGSYEFR